MRNYYKLLKPTTRENNILQEKRILLKNNIKIKKKIEGALSLRQFNIRKFDTKIIHKKISEENSKKSYVNVLKFLNGRELY